MGIFEWLNGDNPEEPEDKNAYPRDHKLPNGKTMRTEGVEYDGDDGDFTINFTIF